MDICLWKRGAREVASVLVTRPPRQVSRVVTDSAQVRLLESTAAARRRRSAHLVQVPVPLNFNVSASSVLKSSCLRARAMAKKLSHEALEKFVSEVLNKREPCPAMVLAWGWMLKQVRHCNLWQ